MSDEYDEKNLIIISNDFSIREDDKVTFMRFYEPLNNQYINFIKKDNDTNPHSLYIAIKQDNTKSAFMGNILIPAPVYLYIKKFEPLLLIIVLISLTIDKENKEEIDFALILNVYSEEVKKGSRINEQDCLNFVKKLLYDNADRLEFICNVKRNDLFDDNSTFKFTMLESKVFDFLNSRVNLSKEQKDVVSAQKESERDIVERMMVKERFEILAKFLPMKIMSKYAECKSKLIYDLRMIDIQFDKPPVVIKKKEEVVKSEKNDKGSDDGDGDMNVKRKNEMDSDIVGSVHKKNKEEPKIAKSIMDNTTSCFGQLKDNTKNNNKSNNKKTANKSASEIKLGQAGIKTFFTAVTK